MAITKLNQNVYNLTIGGPNTPGVLTVLNGQFKMSSDTGLFMIDVVNKKMWAGGPTYATAVWGLDLETGAQFGSSLVIPDGSITNAKIADATIQAAKIASLNADVINAGIIRGREIFAKGDGAASDVHMTTTLPAGYTGGMLEFLYAAVQKGFLAVSSTGRLQEEGFGGISLVSRGAGNLAKLVSEGEAQVIANGAVTVFMNNDGGSDVFDVYSNGSFVFRIDSSGNIRCGGVFQSNDGSGGVDVAYDEYVTNVRMNGGSLEKKYRSHVIKGGIITSRSAESSWTPT